MFGVGVTPITQTIRKQAPTVTLGHQIVNVINHCTIVLLYPLSRHIRPKEIKQAAWQLQQRGAPLWRIAKTAAENDVFGGDVGHEAAGQLGGGNV